MGKPTGFMEYSRLSEVSQPVDERLTNYKEFVLHLTDDQAKTQGARCMDCGIPFCMSGCPVNNIIPDWNDLVYRGNWIYCTPPTISPSSPGVCALRLAKRLVR
jgi:glutamate synthase (NADPH/NADH) small chain